MVYVRYKSEPAPEVKPMEWDRRQGAGTLTGELVWAGNGYRMRVDGFVTSRELYDVHNLTESLIRRFLDPPDDEAIWETDYGEGSCSLYAKERVRSVLNSAEFQAEWAKTERRRAAYRKRVQRERGERA